MCFAVYSVMHTSIALPVWLICHSSKKNVVKSNAKVTDCVWEIAE